MLKPGSTIGGLLIGDLLGRGAMGEVYRAEQISLKRPVAVKRIAEHLIDDDSVVTRFEREAQCIARVSSPQVLAVYEFGRFTDGEGAAHWLLVMELVEGGCNARELLRRGMNWQQATAIIVQVAQGLAAAAEHGIVHRDIKPDNIMIAGNGMAKLADFGLAKAADSLAMTMDGALVGTPYYMAPEACRGEAMDQRGDIYSLAASWYHLVAGRPLFEHRNTMMLLRAHAEEAPQPIRSLCPDLPASLADLLHRCLEKDPDRRPASAAQLLNDIWKLMAQGLSIPHGVPELMGHAAGATTAATTLRATVATSPAQRPPPSWSTLGGELASASDPAPSRRWPLLVLAVGLVILVGAPVFWWQASSASDDSLLSPVADPTVAGPTESPPLGIVGQPPPQVSQRQAGIVLALDRAAAELAEDRPAEAWAWLQTIAKDVTDDAAISERRHELRSATIARAREHGARTLSAGVALMEEGSLAEALRMLERDRAVAHIGGVGERYEDVIKRLRAALSATPPAEPRGE